MSRRARSYREAYAAKHDPDVWEAPDWRDSRDADEDEIPENDEAEPVHTLN